MENRNILISGAGVAGLTLAYWLKRYGFNVTIVEHSPKPREGGYAIDFFGAGFDVAEKMGLLSELEQVDLKIQELTFIDRYGNRKGALDVMQVRRLMHNRFYNLLRSDLAKVLYHSLDKDIEFIFGDSIQRVKQNPYEILIHFASGKFRSFDLLIGADGLHSNIRNLVFGSEYLFEKYYGYYVAAFTIEDYLQSNQRSQNNYSFLSYCIPGKQVNTYSMKENKLTCLFILASSQKLAFSHHNINRQKQLLIEEFDYAGWKCHTLLSKLDAATDFYFDSVSQIKMDSWSDGRVALVGDASFAPSLLAGQGSSLAMAAAYVLAGELKEANGHFKIAFRQYEQIFKPFIFDKQKVAQSFAGSLVPKSNLGLRIRNTVTNLIFSSILSPFVSKWLIRKYMTDNIKLKEY